MQAYSNKFETVPRIRAQNGADFGVEMSVGFIDSLDELVNKSLLRICNSNRFGLKNVLDLGGATGFRAAAMATFGARTVVVDQIDFSEEIKKRNETLAPVKAIRFVNGDVRHFSELPIPREEWDLIQARRVIHWLSWNETKNFVASFSNLASAETKLALCFQDSEAGVRGTRTFAKTHANDFYLHDPYDVLELLVENGWRPTRFGKPPNEGRRSFKIFADRNCL
jgi:SAM-dependent methyltransferase